MEKQGMVHLYVGYGKGKTTAAAGLASRALGQDKRVCFCQFLKAGDSGEIPSLRKLGAVVLHPGCPAGFTAELTMDQMQLAKEYHKDCFARAAQLILSGRVELAVLDEVIDAVNADFLDEDDLLYLIKIRPAPVELVLSGRDPSPEVEAAADYYTDFMCRAHPYYKGVAARRGVEF